MPMVSKVSEIGMNDDQVSLRHDAGFHRYFSSQVRDGVVYSTKMRRRFSSARAVSSTA
jgi:hypothetical protein